MTTTFVDLDVRPILRGGGEPFEAIMQTVVRLGPDQGLRLRATFRPTPLIHVLGSRGFVAEAKELADGDWEVLFHPACKSEVSAGAEASAPVDAAPWPEPVCNLDNRDLDPPEPMVRILAAVEQMRPGEVLSALLRREPVFLLPELKKRGHDWRGDFEADRKAYRILIRV